jgi:hypothetical protein
VSKFSICNSIKTGTNILGLISQKDAGVLELESYWFKGLESSCCNHEKISESQ